LNLLNESFDDQSLLQSLEGLYGSIEVGVSLAKLCLLKDSRTKLRPGLDNQIIQCSPLLTRMILFWRFIWKERTIMILY